jgi:hypothetical protein
LFLLLAHHAPLAFGREVMVCMGCCWLVQGRHAVAPAAAELLIDDLRLRRRDFESRVSRHCWNASRHCRVRVHLVAPRLHRLVLVRIRNLRSVVGVTFAVTTGCCHTKALHYLRGDHVIPLPLLPPLPPDKKPTNTGLNSQQALPGGGSGAVTASNSFVGALTDAYTDSFGSNQLWYRYTSTSTSTVTFSTLGSVGFPASLLVFRQVSVGTNSWQAIAPDTDLYSSTSCALNVPYNYTYACVAVPVAPGHVLAVRVASVDDSAGLAKLSWSTTPRPANDNFAARAALTGGNIGSITATNAHASSEVGEPLYITAASMWYKLTPTRSGILTLRVGSAVFSPRVDVLSDLDGTLPSLEAAGTVVPCATTLETNCMQLAGVVSGKTYVIAVWTDDSLSRGTFTLKWSVV